jgi:hypothetical protein
MNPCVDVELKHLRSFVAVPQERNFTRAAESRCCAFLYFAWTATAATVRSTSPAQRTRGR